MKKISLIIGLFIAIVFIVGVLFSGWYFFLRDNSEKLTYDDVEDQIEDILKVEGRFDDLDYDDEFLEESENILDKHLGEIEDLEELLDELDEDDFEEELIAYVEEWIGVKKEQNSNSSKLLKLISELEDADEDDLEDLYEDIIKVTNDISTHERDSISILDDYIEYKDDKLDEDATFEEELEEGATFLEDFSSPFSGDGEVGSIDTDSNKVDHPDDKSEDKIEAEQDTKQESTLEESETESTSLTDTQVFKNAVLLARGHEDRLPMALEICHNEGIPEDDLVFLRFMASDGEWAFVIASPGNDVQTIGQYVMKKSAGNWSVVAKYGPSEDVRMLVKQDIPDFNPNTLPSYDLMNYDISYISNVAKQDIYKKLINKGLINSKTYIYYMSQIDNYLFIFCKDNTRLLVDMNDSTLNTITSLNSDYSYASYHNYVGINGPVMIFIQD